MSSLSRTDPRHRRRLYAVLAVLAVVAVGLIAWQILHKPPPKPAKPHPIPVSAVRVGQQDFEVELTAIGAAQAWVSDLILAQVTGKLIRVDFAEGSDVKAGQLLAEVDPRPYRAALAQAEANLLRDRAALAGAQRDLERYQHLAGEGGVSRQILEDQIATVGQDQGAVAQDRAAIQAARINLEFCRITSPISGRAGVRMVDPGNLVSASGSVSSQQSTASATSAAAPTGGSASPSNASASTGPATNSGSSGGTGIVVINKVQPIAVTFTVPQNDFQRLLAASDGFTRPLPVQAISQETGAVLGTGELRIADNRVDQATGTVAMKAEFANAGRSLWPGQFVNVRLGVQKLKGVVLLPLNAVNRGPNGQYAFVVGPGNKVVMSPVTVRAIQGQVAVIGSGVKPGDVVVTDGQMVLNKGSLVKVAHLVPVGSATP